MKRRDFLRKTVAAAAAGISAPWMIPSRVLAAPGPNDQIVVGFIGLGGRARWIVTNEGLPGGRIVAVADCFQRRLDDAAKWVPEAEKWNRYSDYHEMFEKEKLDAVFVETTTHARVLTCIHALQAGLDVYGEKPASHNIYEGERLVQVARRTQRMLQIGSQHRSEPFNRGPRIVSTLQSFK